MGDAAFLVENIANKEAFLLYLSKDNLYSYTIADAYSAESGSLVIDIPRSNNKVSFFLLDFIL